MPPSNAIEQAKQDYLHAKNQLCSALANIPEDRLNWSPSPTARTPIEIVAHCAIAVKSIHEQMTGTPFHFNSTEEADIAFRKEELQFHTSEQVLGYLEEVSTRYTRWLDTVTADNLNSMVVLPFGLGAMPLENWLQISPNHTRGHIAQLEYLQTVYGDRDWHLR